LKIYYLLKNGVKNTSSQKRISAWTPGPEVDTMRKAGI